jgi:hypothetical protein
MAPALAAAENGRFSDVSPYGNARSFLQLNRDAGPGLPTKRRGRVSRRTFVQVVDLFAVEP